MTIREKLQGYPNWIMSEETREELEQMRRTRERIERLVN